MSTFLISDIHGNNDLFRRSLKQIGLKKSDKLILLGDLIDRGPDSKGVLDTIILLFEHGFNVDCLIGNHEKMFLDSFKDNNCLNQWLINGGDKTLASFLTSSIEKIPLRYFDLINSFNYYVEVGSYLLVHAAVNMTIENPLSDINTILWERNPKVYFNRNWLGNRKIIHGHNPQRKEDIVNSVLNNNSYICIDNGWYSTKPGFGSMCVLELENLSLNFFR